MRENYLSIQYLRAFAAILVVIHHTRNPHAWLFNPLENFQGFARGVDIFFVISGFIMAAIGSKESPKDFAKKRIIRVAPIYWLASILVLLQISRKEGLSDELITRFIQSILFIPHTDPNGNIYPILIPGWTLNYEMFFYGIFCICLFSKKPIINSCIALLSLTMLGLLTSSSSPIYNTYTSTKLVEFCAGLIIGANRHNIVKQPRLAALMPFGLFFIFTSQHWAVITLSSAAIVVSIVALEKITPQISTMKTLGDASYFIYISHHFTVGKIHELWSKIQLTGDVQFCGIIATSTIASCAIGVAGHFLFEKPLTTALQRKFSAQKSIKTTSETRRTPH